jgi:hypothetical protein
MFFALTRPFAVTAWPEHHDVPNCDDASASWFLAVRPRLQPVAYAEHVKATRSPVKLT